MPFQLLIARGAGEGQQYIVAQPEARIGRTSENDIVLHDAGVSRHHARIFERDGRCFAEDLGSRLGTYVNGARIEAAHELKTGDALGVGPVVFAFRVVPVSAEAPPKKLVVSDRTSTDPELLAFEQAVTLFPGSVDEPTAIAPNPMREIEGPTSPNAERPARIEGPTEPRAAMPVLGPPPQARQPVQVPAEEEGTQDVVGAAADRPTVKSPPVAEAGEVPTPPGGQKQLEAIAAEKVTAKVPPEKTTLKNAPAEPPREVRATVALEASKAQRPNPFAPDEAGTDQAPPPLPDRPAPKPPVRATMRVPDADALAPLASLDGGTVRDDDPLRGKPPPPVLYEDESSSEHEASAPTRGSGLDDSEDSYILRSDVDSGSIDATPETMALKPGAKRPQRIPDSTTPARPQSLDRLPPVRREPPGLRPKRSAVPAVEVEGEDDGDDERSKLQLFWETMPRSGRVVVGASIFVVMAAAAATAVLALAPGRGDRAEPTRLSSEPIRHSFGVGDGVDWWHDEIKIFTFEVPSRPRTVPVLHGRAQDVDEGEIEVALNGAPVATLPHRAAAFQVVLEAPRLKPGAENQLSFNRRAFGGQTWRVQGLWLELFPLPELTRERLVERASEHARKGRELDGLRDQAGENLFLAWQQWRSAYLTLHGVGEGERPELFAVARGQVELLGRLVDQQCDALLTEAADAMSAGDRGRARRALEEARRYFPTREHRCHNQAIEQSDAYDL